MSKKAIILRITILLLVTSMIIPMFKGFSAAEIEENDIIKVDDSGGANYFIIQDAINAANHGDTIYVYSGTYFENIVIDKTINLVGEDKDTTIIDGSNMGDVITLASSSNGVNLTGFTIQNSGSGSYESGIDINSDYNTIAGNNIKNNEYGIALDLWGHNCKIFSNNFENNIYGILVYSVYPNNNTIYHNNFENNIINAYDDSNSNWTKDGQGNYWDDYNGTDNNDDGIGDTPYLIPGGSTQDDYPLMNKEEHETPGFETITIISAIIIALIILKRKKTI